MADTELKQKVKRYQEYLYGCTNKGFGGHCYEFCAMRENGCCEFSEMQIISDCLELMTGTLLQSSTIDKKFLKELVDLALRDGGKA